MFRINVCRYAFLLAAGLTLSGPAQLVAAQDNAAPPPVATLYGCVNNSSGSIRIVQSFETCKATEHKIKWNQQGPKGPQGPPGPKGSQGDQGAQGPPGISVGYSSTVAPATDIPLTSAPVLVAETTPVGTSGTYFIAASGLPYVASGDGYAFCYDTKASVGDASQYGGAYTSGGYVQASVSDVLFVATGDTVQLYCYAGGSGSYLYNAGITATLINSSKKAKMRQFSQRHVPPEQAHSR